MELRHPTSSRRSAGNGNGALSSATGAPCSLAKLAGRLMVCNPMGYWALGKIPAPPKNHPGGLGLACHDCKLMNDLARPHPIIALVVAALAVQALATACGSGNATLPGAPPEAPLDSNVPKPLPDAGYVHPVGSPCTEAEVKTCKVLLPAHGPIRPCFVGVQICTEGKWGPCIDPPADAGRAGNDSAMN